MEMLPVRVQLAPFVPTVTRSLQLKSPTVPYVLRGLCSLLVVPSPNSHAYFAEPVQLGAGVADPRNVTTWPIEAVAGTSAVQKTEQVSEGSTAMIPVIWHVACGGVPIAVTSFQL